MNQDRWTNGRTNEQTDGQTRKHNAHNWGIKNFNLKQADKWTNEPTIKWTEGQTNRRTDQKT